jgi:hypothetical protein
VALKRATVWQVSDLSDSYNRGTLISWYKILVLVLTLQPLYKKYFMATYSKTAGNKVKESMHEMKEGKLKTGSGKKVTSRKQAIAIGLSEAREKGAKVPAKKTTSKAGRKKTAK